MLLCVIEIVNPTNERENGNSSGRSTEPLVAVVKCSSVFVWGRAAIYFFLMKPAALLGLQLIMSPN